jgi:LuxR family maltose regulon positive regulatory protein
MASILATKLHRPVADAAWVDRSRLFARLDAGLRRRLTLVSAPAGYGKTTLIAAWIADRSHPAAWVSLDASDRDPARFATYLTLGLRAFTPEIGSGVLRGLQSGQPPPLDALVTALINELAALSVSGIIVLDDYHLVDSDEVDRALTLLIDHLPAQIHLVIATREDPDLPLARWRGRDQLSEVRIADLRFSPEECAAFLTTRVDSALMPEDIQALHQRTEGWAVGLQLASLSLQGSENTAAFIRSFSGSHRFVLDYLVEEVLRKLPADVERFLLRTSILQRLCGPLCDAMLEAPDAASMRTLAQLERANLFLIPLDAERRWYRYHHLFAELLRQRLQQHEALAPLQIKASAWCEANGLDFEAFEYAVAADDLERAARLCEGAQMPLHFRGGLSMVLSWLDRLPAHAFADRPSLRVTYASALLFIGRLGEIEPIVRAAEVRLPDHTDDPTVRDLIGRIASIRATLGVSQHNAHTIETHARRALDYLHPANTPVRASVTWALGHAYLLRNQDDAAARAFDEALPIAEKLRHTMVMLLCKGDQGVLMERARRFDDATALYRQMIDLCGEPALPVACQAHFGLARVALAQGAFDDAEAQTRRGIALAMQLPTTDRVAAGELLLGHIALARGDVAEAQSARQRAERAGADRHATTIAEFAQSYHALRAGLAHTGSDIEQSLVEPLSEREREILRLIAQGLSNGEIAGRLHLALSTVKGHNMRIFGKLGAGSRTEALARAHDAGLL